jgi:hypothetical protein
VLRTPAAVLAAFLDRHRLPVLVLFSFAFFVAAALHASAKPFWHDEIYTVLLARLPSVQAHWAALRDGVDFAPPLNGFATRAVRTVAGSGAIAARIPAMVGFWVMLLAIYAMVRRRGNATLALAAAFIPFFTAAYRYSYEARPYGLMIALAALAWLAWTEAARGTRRPLFLSILGVALAAGLWNHYFAALAFAPIAAGELVRSIRDRRIDAPAWLVTIGSLAAAAPLYPLLRGAAAQTRHFWVRPSIADIAATYQFLFATLASGFAGWTLLAIAAAIAISFAWPAQRHPGLEPIPAHEVAAAVVAVLLPVIGVLLALLVTGAFVPRYTMPTVPAVSIVLPLTIARLARRAPLADVALLAALAAAYLVSAARPIPRPGDPFAARPLFVRSLQMPGRTVAAGQLWFLQLWFYAPPALKPRVVYLADPDLALRYTGSDIVDRNYLALARWTPVPVERFDTFVDHNAGFRVYSAGAGWLLDRLRDQGASVETVGSEAGGQLYQVTVAPGRTIPR